MPDVEEGLKDDTQTVPEMEEGMNIEEMEQEGNGYSPGALTERTLRTVADRIRQMDGRYMYKGDGDTQANKYSKQ